MSGSSTEPAHVDAAVARLNARDAAIEAVLPSVAAAGWTPAAVRAAAGAGADLLFPGGSADMVEAYIDFADRRMVAAAAPMIADERPSRRVRTLIAVRLAQAADERAAVRRGLAVLARPGHAAVAARTLARTVDTIWHAAGDVSADFNWYTKRALLAGVYTTTLLYWLSGRGDEAATLAFLDRRLAGVAQIGKLRARLSGGGRPPETRAA